MRSRILLIICSFAFLASCEKINYDELAEKLQIDDRISDQMKKITDDYEDRIQELENEVEDLEDRVKSLESKAKNTSAPKPSS